MSVKTPENNGFGIEVAFQMLCQHNRIIEKDY